MSIDLKAKGSLIFADRQKALSRPSEGLYILEPLSEKMCEHCLDQITEKSVRGTVIGTRVSCKVCGTTFKAVECMGEYAEVAKAILDDAIQIPGEYEPDPGTIELSKKYGTGLGVQTVAFLKNKWPELRKAKNWLVRNGYKAKHAGNAKLYHVFYQMPSNWIARGSARIVGFGNGIKAIVGRVHSQFVGKDPLPEELTGMARDLPISRRLDVKS